MTTISLKFQSFGAAILLTALIACAPQPQNPQDLREKTAQATSEMKNDAKAVAQGVRDGLTRDKTIDLNSATKDQLMTLPGLTAAQADRIIDNRPYDDPNDLLTKKVLPRTEYDKIADRVVVKK
jgi:DNA uptake protein ComE-like DNA-binding protein